MAPHETTLETRSHDDRSVAARTPGSAIRGALVSARQQWVLERGLRLECGAWLAPVEVAFETWGTLNEAGDNAIVVCHALTGDAHAAGASPSGGARLGWWDPLIGPGRVLDTDRYFVVCANALGGCQGTTGPNSLAPENTARPGRPYGSTFPQVTVRDIVRLQHALLRALGVRRLVAVTGGSLGGMQVLEWMVMYHEFVAAAIPIAASLAHTAQGIAYNLVGREAILRDPAWAGGDFYETGRSPDQGLALARMLGIITYQSEASMRHKFDRERVDGTASDPVPVGSWSSSDAGAFQVERYLRYQGASLVERFDANSYLVLTRAMDLHDVGWGRGGLDAALRRVSPDTRTLVIGIDSDILFPTHHQRETVDRLRALGRHARYHEIHSPWGHDAFLIEHEQMSAAIIPFLKGHHTMSHAETNATAIHEGPAQDDTP